MGLSLGIDIGSVSISCVLLNEHHHRVQSVYRLHHGNILNTLRGILYRFDWSDITHLGFNQKAARFFKYGCAVNDQIALVEGIKSEHVFVRSLFTIGAETFGLFLFDKNQNYQKFLANSSCAAGTGLFLDQQALRLGLQDSAELSEKALAYHSDPPKIATRCAVFAKTDLIHCQQQGYSIEAICAGLCRGLAVNICDTILGGIKVEHPVYAVGGVCRNKKVLSYLSEIIGHPIRIPETSLLIPAIGCAIIASENINDCNEPVATCCEDVLSDRQHKKHYFFGPLEPRYSRFPDFSGQQHFIADEVEVDIYERMVGFKKIPVMIGLDVGSTSTKAVVMGAHQLEKKILAGLYTRTNGQPIIATQRLLRQLRHIENRFGFQFKILGAGTTGSGRKFLHNVLNTDYVIDEITAHARAAYELNPLTDTIIEIGGQDSKFTVMNKGRVTFSVMNYVCAAGTGSFIEEQAKRLGIALENYSDLALHQRSPLISDRCTVFMERDLNHFLSLGYRKEELLATTLHSVRDNYLAKVANLNKIGDVICFQGATAKNTALVCAFEQKLQKPIFVSRYCHLTGALGVCLFLIEQQIHSSRFKGIDFYQQHISTEEVICEECTNHCKINHIQIGDQGISWGYLCGRDETGRISRSLAKKEFDLLHNRRRIFNPKESTQIKQREDNGISRKSLLDIDLDKLKENLEINFLALRHKIFTLRQDDIGNDKSKQRIRIGLPDTLYMNEYFPFWYYFFKRLGFMVIKSPAKRSFIQEGKELSAAEFCTPISAWHGNIRYLAAHADYIFAPQMFEEQIDSNNKNYCYYSQYAVSIVANLPETDIRPKIIAPVIDFSQHAIHNIHRIYESFPQELKLTQSPVDIQYTYHHAWQWFIQQKETLVNIFRKRHKNTSDIQVVLLGRPYLLTDPELNKNITQIFLQLGIATFFQDMLPLLDRKNPGKVSEYLEWNHWKYGAEILEAAEFTAQQKHLFPVYLTAFKCSPDSFLLRYFREIMDFYDCPYLILQIDDHGSDVGYETRIEAAVRTFRNHYHQKFMTPGAPKNQRIHRRPYNPDSVLIPDYDTLSCSLIRAAFLKAGYNAYLIKESPSTITSSLRLNDGQCLPITAIVQAATECIKENHLDPGRTALFLNTITNLSCNFPQYPIMAKQLFDDVGDGFERVHIFASDFEMTDFPLEVITDVYIAYLLGGLLRKMGCRIRPYETKCGMTDEVIEECRESLYQGIITKKSREKIFTDIITRIQHIPVKRISVKKPKVSIIGDLYVRDNDVFNQRLIRSLEDYGAEVVTSPFTLILRILALKHKSLLKGDGRFLSLIKFGLLIEHLEKIERRYYKIASEPFPDLPDDLLGYMKKFNLSLEHGGETAQNILKIYTLIRHYQDLSLFIHVNPIFCCPGLVSESILKNVEKDIGIPIISITYDGTSTRQNSILAPHIRYLQQREMIH